jgi:quinolinate synthase
MAETAALLSPDRIVVIPDINAGCPMADMIDGDTLAHFRKDRPDAIVVCYVNSTAEVKAQSHVCCTSANAVEIVSRVPENREIIFVPDQFLGGYVQRKTGRKLILWPGYCRVHTRLKAEHVQKRRAEFPEAAVIVHPECRQEVCDLADEVLSTGGMCRFSAATHAKTIVVGTETGILHRLQKENPDKRFVPLLESAVCPNMKLATLSKIENALHKLEPRVQVPDDIAEKARAAIIKMLSKDPIV